MKLSISNIAWEEQDDEKMYKYLNKMGIDAIEIAPTRIFTENPYEKIEEAKRFSEDLYNTYNLNISSMQSIWYGRTENIFKSFEERKILIEYTKKAIKFAKAIKCENLVFGCPKNRNTNNYNEDYNIAIEFFREIGEYAIKNGTCVAIEPNPKIYNTNFINTTKEAFDIVKKINSKGVKVNIDIGTVIENQEDKEENILQIIKNNIELVNHIHISEPYLEQIKRRKIHQDLNKILKENDYKKYISIEMKCLKDVELVKEIIKYEKEVFYEGK